MSSNIEKTIEEIEDYIDGCKYQPLSKINIIVNKEEIDELIAELRNRTPEEIKKCKKVIEQREEILAKARERAAKMIKDTTDTTNQLINEHEIMQQAYAQAHEVVTLASEQAQQILDNAAAEAKDVRDRAMQYLDEMLEHLDTIMTNSMNTTSAYYDEYMKAMMSYHNMVSSNRAELHPDADIMQDVSELNVTIPGNGNANTGVDTSDIDDLL
mgnify:CR=1 FL=1